jgi:hypothetical protein
MSETEISCKQTKKKSNEKMAYFVTSSSCIRTGEFLWWVVRAQKIRDSITGSFYIFLADISADKSHL